MTRETIYHCSGQGCRNHIQSMDRPPVRGWIELRHGTDRGVIYDFCSWDCVLKFAAQFEPTEVL